MTDTQLAEWQAGWKEHTGNFILAEREWERRMISHEFSLQTKLAANNNRWLLVSAFIGVVGTLAGALLGAQLSNNNSKTIQESPSLSKFQLNLGHTKPVNPDLQKQQNVE